MYVNKDLTRKRPGSKFLSIVARCLLSSKFALDRFYCIDSYSSRVLFEISINRVVFNSNRIDNYRVRLTILSKTWYNIGRPVAPDCQCTCFIYPQNDKRYEKEDSKIYPLVIFYYNVINILKGYMEALPGNTRVKMYCFGHSRRSKNRNLKWK